MKVKSAAAGDRDRDGDGVSPWRILEFAAEEMAVDAGAIEVVPRLRTEEMEALVKRLVATVKHAIETPTAVLEVKCLIYGMCSFSISLILLSAHAFVHPIRGIELSTTPFNQVF